MLIAGLLALSDPPHDAGVEFGSAILGFGWLRVDEQSGTIAELGRGPAPASPDLEGTHGAPLLISPAFVDTHLHLPQFDSVGADGLGLLAWLREAVFPAEARWADPDFAGQMATRVARKLLAHGTTAVAAYATVHHEGTRNAIRALSDAGLRGHVGQVLMDQEAPSELVRPAAQLIREASTLRPVGRIEPAVTPRFAVSCSRELLAGAGELAQASRAFVQTHLSETREECRRVRTLHGAVTYTEVYRRAGLLGSRTLLGHGIWLNQKERAMLAEMGSTIAHCPTANLFLESGSMNLGENRRAGVRTCLGSDIAGGSDVSMPRVARAMIETAKSRRLLASPAFRARVTVPSAAQAWWQITTGNACTLALPGNGVLQAGAIADLVIIDPARGPEGDREWSRRDDPIGAVLYGWDPRWITHTFAAGKPVYSA